MSWWWHWWSSSMHSLQYCSPKGAYFEVVSDHNLSFVIFSTQDTSTSCQVWSKLLVSNTGLNSCKRNLNPTERNKIYLSFCHWLHNQGFPAVSWYSGRVVLHLVGEQLSCQLWPHHHLVVSTTASISHKKITQFCCALFCCGYIISSWWIHVDGLVQERHNSGALAMELSLSCTNPSISSCLNIFYAIIFYFFLLWYIWCDLFTHVIQGYFTGTGAIIGLSQCQWSNPEGYGYNQPVPTHNKSQQRVNHVHNSWDVLHMFQPKYSRLCFHIWKHTIERNQAAVKSMWWLWRINSRFYTTETVTHSTQASMTCKFWSKYLSVYDGAARIWGSVPLKLGINVDVTSHSHIRQDG